MCDDDGVELLFWSGWVLVNFVGGELYVLGVDCCCYVVGCNVVGI